MNMHVVSELALELHRQAVERRRRMALAAVSNEPKPQFVRIKRDESVTLVLSPAQAKRWMQGEIERREAVLAAREKAMNAALALFTENEPKRVTARHIIKEVAKKHDVSVKDIIGPWRRAELVEARQEAMYRMRTETMMSFPQIGRALGGRDHTTALHGYRRHEARLRASQAAE